MSEEILINITPMESRVAVVENGVLQEVHVERTQKRGIVGNIYKGKVVRVLPGMQAAFVDIGLDRAAFIHASEISLREGPAVESISALVHEGQSLVVQVTKDPIGSKGARLTTQLSIPSRREISEAWINAARSRPMSTKAACIPGNTRTTLPL